MPSSPSTPFLSSNEHLAGCIATLIGYVLVLIGIISWSWYNTLFIFYTGGWLIGIKFFLSNQYPQVEEPLNMPADQPSDALKIATPISLKAKTHQPSTYQSSNSQFIDDFLKLKLKHELDLPYPAIQILNEIHQVLLMLYQQTQQRSDLFAIEINNTQKIIYEYLQPTIENYSNVPRYYAGHRIIQNGKTAADLLIEQLELLKEELYALLDNILADNLTGLTLHAEFLKQKLKPYQFFKIHLES